MFKDLVFDYVKTQFGTAPEYLWENSPESAVLILIFGQHFLSII